MKQRGKNRRHTPTGNTLRRAAAQTPPSQPVTQTAPSRLDDKLCHVARPDGKLVGVWIGETDGEWRLVAYFSVEAGDIYVRFAANCYCDPFRDDLWRSTTRTRLADLTPGSPAIAEAVRQSKGLNTAERLFDSVQYFAERKTAMNWQSDEPR